MQYTPEQIATLLANRTPGEWTYSQYHPWVNWGDREPEPSYELDGPVFSLAGYDTLDREGDAAFIAAAPAIIEQQTGQIAELDAAWEKLMANSVDHVIARDDKIEQQAERIKELETELRLYQRGLSILPPEAIGAVLAHIQEDEAKAALGGDA